MTQNHPTYPFAGRFRKGRFGASSTADPLARMAGFHGLPDDPRAAAALLA
jgi:hypothetical protein